MLLTRISPSSTSVDVIFNTKRLAYQAESNPAFSQESSEAGNRAISIHLGGLAQLARAPALHAGGQRFESVILHSFGVILLIFFILMLFLSPPSANCSGGRVVF